MRYVIVGNGVAGTTAALALRRRDAAASIALISGETDYFFSRTALMYAFMDKLTRRDLEPNERVAYDRQRITRLRGWVADIDAPAHQLTLRDGSTIAYDRLLLATGSVPIHPGWPGLDQHPGVTHFVTMDDLDRCEQLVPSTKQAVVVGGGLIGVELIECLTHHGVNVTFLVREPWYWPAALGGPEAAMVSDHIRHHGIDVRIDNVARVDSTGVHTDSGAALPCQLLGISIGVRPAIDWLRSVSTPPDLDRGIRVAPNFATSLPDVFAAGDCAEIVRPDGSFIEQIWYTAKNQGDLAARAMLGDPIDYTPPIFYNSSKFFDIEYTTVGQVNNAPAGSREFYFRFPNREISVRVIEHSGAVVGFNMLGSRWNHAFFEQWIVERRPLAWVLDHLQDAQFDVEFGRLDLAPLRKAAA